MNLPNQQQKKKNQELEIKKKLKLLKGEKNNLIDLIILIFFKDISFVFNI